MKRFICSALILLSASVIMAQDYYWYKGNKMPLQYGNRQYIIYVADKLSESDQLKLEYTEDLIYADIPNLKWGATKPGAVIEDAENVLYHTHSYLMDGYDHDAFVTHRFLVKLKNNEDLAILQNMAEQYLAEFEEGVALPWRILRCKLKGQYNALELANIFYESGLFAAAEPEFIGAVVLLDDTPQILSDKSTKSSKLLRDGQLLIEKNGRTFTTLGTQVK